MNLKKTLKSTVKFCVFFLMCLQLTSCHMQWRNPDLIPEQLRNLYLQTPNPYDNLTVALRSQLKALNIKLATSPNQAQATLQITRNVFKNNYPDISTTNIAIAYTATLTVTAVLINNNGALITSPRTFVASTQQILNVNQIYTNNNNELVQQQLIHDILSDIYYWLTSNEITHAASARTIKYTP